VRKTASISGSLTENPIDPRWKMEFRLKPGRITLARLSQASRDLEVVTGTAEVLRAPLSFSGTSGVVRFDRAAGDVLDALLARGLEHHLALTYGDHVAVLKKLAQTG
jgi:L-fucose isomerase-like protein